MDTRLAEPPAKHSQYTGKGKKVNRPTLPINLTGT